MRILTALFLSLFVIGCPAQDSAPREPKADESPNVQNSPPSPAQADPAPPAPAQATGPAVSFEGIWSTRDDQGEAFDMVIFPNGQAVTTWSKGIDGARGERGFWRRENNRLVAVYHDGWTDVLEPVADGFLHKGFSPETHLGAPPTNSAPAVKITAPAANFAGIWRMNREPDGSYQYVALYSGGQGLEHSERRHGGNLGADGKRRPLRLAQGRLGGPDRTWPARLAKTLLGGTRNGNTRRCLAGSAGRRGKVHHHALSRNWGASPGDQGLRA